MSEVIKVWKGDDGEFYCEDADGTGGQVIARWWHGCRDCGAYEDEINEIMTV